MRKVAEGARLFQEETPCLSPLGPVWPSRLAHSFLACSIWLARQPKRLSRWHRLARCSLTRCDGQRRLTPLNPRCIIQISQCLFKTVRTLNGSGVPRQTDLFSGVKYDHL
jgi:hypothetical protein